MAKINLSAPWVSYYHQIEALFQYDDEVCVIYDETNCEITLRVETASKATALDALLPHEVTFGNVTLKITVVPANEDDSKVAMLARAFEGNPALSYIQEVSMPSSDAIHYVVFANEVVQYWNDDLSDVNGNCSTLYQEIAKDVFGDIPGVFFCTEDPDLL